MAAASEVLELARRELGTREEPYGSNRVKYNTDYYGREVSGGAYPWCCVFLWWLFRKAEAAELFYDGDRTASCGTLMAWARGKGRLVTAEYLPGDLVFLRFSGSGGPQHVGIVETVGREALVTIEGNTGVGNDANGGQVQRRERPYRYVLGAYRPAYEEENMTQQQFDAMMEAWLERRAEQEPGTFSAEARAWAEETGLILGDTAGRKQYKSFCTREQLMTFLYRLVRMKKQ